MAKVGKQTGASIFAFVADSSHCACVLRAQARAHEAIGHVRYSRGEFEAAKREHTVAFELAREAEHVVGRVEGTQAQKRAMQAVASAKRLRARKRWRRTSCGRAG